MNTVTMASDHADGAAAKTRGFAARAAGIALVAGTVAAGALAVAPAGNASCMSFFGRGNNDQCFSSATSVAIALGDSAVAYAGGMFSLAFADSRGVTAPPTGCNTSGNGGDRCTSAFVGPDEGGLQNQQSVAVARGEGAVALIGAGSDYPVTDPCVSCVAVSLDSWETAAVNGGRLNAAINIGNRNTVSSKPALAAVQGGSGNVAANINTLNQGFGQSFAEVYGSRSVAVNIGTTNTQQAGLTRAGSKKQPATSSVAFNLGGADHRGGNNNVEALGDQAIAGAVAQTGVSVTQTGPGRTIKRGAAAGSGAAKAVSAKAAPAAARDR